MRDVDARDWIVGADPEGRAGACGEKRLSQAQDGQRAEKATRVDVDIEIRGHGAG